MKKLFTLLITLISILISNFVLAQDVPPMPIYANKTDSAASKNMNRKTVPKSANNKVKKQSNANKSKPDNHNLQIKSN